MPEDGNGTVRVTLRDVYEAVNTLGRKVDEVQHEVNKLTVISQTIPDHEARLRVLEASTRASTGSAATMRWLIPLLVSASAVAVAILALFEARIGG